MLELFLVALIFNYSISAVARGRSKILPLSWYFPVITIPILKEILVGTFWYQNFGRSPLIPPKRGALDPFWSTQPLSKAA
jgi:hypothetical protein